MEVQKALRDCWPQDLTYTHTEIFDFENMLNSIRYGCLVYRTIIATYSSP